MGFSLLRLSREQMVDVSASRVPSGIDAGIAAESLPPDFIASTALRHLSEGKSSLWCGVFLILRDADSLVVGSCCFKDEPRDGRVEIGYGISPAYRRQGAAAHSVAALVALAFEGGASAVLAEVSPCNIASTNLVRKLGFIDSGRRDDEDDGPVTQWLAKVDA
jgi:RimJ/RimL family protein N-acetyltransferase